MDLWDLKDALLENQVEDEVLYEVDGAEGARIKGKLLKDPSFIRMLEHDIRLRADNPNEVAKYHPNMYQWQVRQLDDQGLSFSITPEFNGIKETAKELQMPSGKSVYYQAHLFSGTSFSPFGRHVPETFRQYTVEALGIRINPLPPSIAEIWGSKIPAILSGDGAPFYVDNIDNSLTEVWRLRILPCPVEQFSFSPSFPLTLLEPGMIYFELRWHPHKGVEEMFRNVHEVRTQNPALFDRFKTDTFFLLGEGPRFGRNPNSGAIPTREAFMETYNRVLESWANNEPPPEVFAEAFGVTAGTYSRYARLYGVFRPRRGITSQEE